MNPLLHRAPMENGTIKLEYIGKMEWGDKYGIDSRMWNVISPKLKGYPTGPLAGVPTLTLDGLKQKGLI